MAPSPAGAVAGFLILVATLVAGFVYAAGAHTAAWTLGVSCAIGALFFGAMDHAWGEPPGDAVRKLFTFPFGIVFVFAASPFPWFLLWAGGVSPYPLYIYSALFGALVLVELGKIAYETLMADSTALRR